MDPAHSVRWIARKRKLAMRDAPDQAFFIEASNSSGRSGVWVGAAIYGLVADMPRCRRWTLHGYETRIIGWQSANSGANSTA